MNRPIRRLSLALFIGLAMLLANVTYIQVGRGPEYRDDPRNPRVLLERSSKERGTIVDAGGRILAQSTPNPADQSAYLRAYPEGPLTAHAVGFSSVLFGDRGLEQAYAADLRSKQDVTISDLVSALLGRDLRPQSLVLSLDADVQQAASDGLGSHHGAVVALDARTGAIVAYVSAPSFDPAGLLLETSAAAGDALEADPAKPLLDRVVGETYPPGSTFKLVTAAAALEGELATPETRFPDVAEYELPGSTAVIRNFDRRSCSGGGDVELAVAFQRSCNTVFAELGVRIGAAGLEEQAARFGFGQPIPFIYDVQSSVFPSSEAFESNEAALAQSAIGQRDVRATPLQMVAIAAAIANDGILMQPYLVQQVVDADGSVTETTEPAELWRAVSENTAAALAGMMERVVASGTGTGAAVDGLTVAGKTGTAETAAEAPDVWFVGYADDGARRLAIAVIVEEGGAQGPDATGGSVAAPIARDVFVAWRDS